MKLESYIGLKFKKNGVKHIIFIVDDIYTVTNSKGEIIKQYFTAYNDSLGQKIFDYEIPVSTVMKGLIKWITKS